MKKKLLSLLLASAMMIQMMSGVPLNVQAKDKAVAQTTEVKAATDLQLSIRRAADNVVTMNWNAVEGAVSYNVYDIPYAGTSTKLGNTKDTTFVADKLEVGKVHTLTVKAVDASGTEISTSNSKKVGITEKIDVAKDGVKTLEDNKGKLKLPVSDLAGNMDYVGPTIQDDQYHYWCYSSIKDEEGKVHLFMSRVPRSVGFIPGWKTTSEIVHFVGDSSEGPFTEVGVPFAPGTLPDGQQSAHNPRIKKVGDKYVLLYIVRYNYQGAGREGYQTTCMATIDKLPTEPGSDTIDKWELATDTGLDLANPGKVDEAKKGLKNGVIIRYGLKSVNPDMFKVTDENGKDEYVMYFKGNKNPNVEAGPYFLYTATAENLMGPYTLKGEATDSKTTIEDPSVFEWKGKYFMLTYDLGNGISGAGKEVGMLIPSRDPYHFSFKDAWITAGLLPDYLTMPQGYTHAYSGSTRMERPYIVFEDDAPKYFIGTNSAGVDGNKVTQSYTFKFNELPTHKLAVDENLEDGKIEIVDNVTEAQIFDDIIVKVTPDEGKELVPDSVKVTSNDAMGRPYTSNVEKLEDGTYRFMMPSGDATVTAQFKGEGAVDRVEITPNKIDVVRGKSHNFFASVIGTGDYLKTVDWSVEGGTAKTTISEDGVLSVDAAETAETLTVKATSKDDETKSATAEVTVLATGSNIALGLGDDAYTASSYHANAPGTVKCFPKYVFDGSTTYNGVNQLWTPKSIGGVDPDPWIQVNFGKATEFNTVKIYDYGKANGGQFTSVEIQVSDDGETWETVNGKAFTFTGTEEVKVCEFDTVKKQYMRVGKQVTTPAGKLVHLLEVEVYNEVQVDAPAIETQPEDQKVELGEKATFSVDATGTDLTYQWQVSKDNGETWEIIEGATAAEYTTEALTMENNENLYRCIVSNSEESIATEAAALEVFCEHAWDADYTVDVEPTCTEDGSKSIHCDKCGEVKDVQTIPALGHAFGDWKVVKEATATEDGCKERTCTRCDHKETKVILATGETTPPSTDKPEKPEKPGSDVPPTGDSTNMMVWGAALCAGLAVILGKRKKEEN